MIAFTKPTSVDGVPTIGVYRDGCLIGTVETHKENALVLMKDGGLYETKGRNRTELAKQWVRDSEKPKTPKFIR